MHRQMFPTIESHYNNQTQYRSPDVLIANTYHCTVSNAIFIKINIIIQILLFS